MSTTLGIGSYAFSWSIGVPGYEKPARPLTALDLVRFAAESGVHLVQIADNLPLDTFEPRDFAVLLDEAQKHGVAIEVGTRGIAPEHLRTYLRIAQRCQSPILRVVIDTKTHQPSPDEIVSTLVSLLPEFERAGVTLAIENHDRFKVRTLANIIADIDSPYVGICLDTVNSFGALEAPDVIVEILGRYVVNLHIKDFSIRRAGHNLGFLIEGTPAGKGMLDTSWLLRRLLDDGRTFNAILELWTPQEATMQATVEKETAWVHESLIYLRTLIED